MGICTRAWGRKSKTRGGEPCMGFRMVSGPGRLVNNGGIRACGDARVYTVEIHGFTDDRNVFIGPLTKEEFTAITDCVARIRAGAAGLGGADNSGLGDIIETNRTISAQSESCDELAAIVGLRMQDGRNIYANSRIVKGQIDRLLRYVEEEVRHAR